MEVRTYPNLPGDHVAVGDPVGRHPLAVHPGQELGGRELVVVLEVDLEQHVVVAHVQVRVGGLQEAPHLLRQLCPLRLGQPGARLKRNNFGLRYSLKSGLGVLTSIKIGVDYMRM